MRFRRKADAFRGQLTKYGGKYAKKIFKETLINRLLKEALIKSFVHIAPSDFSSDCLKFRAQADACVQNLGQYGGKYASKMCKQLLSVIYSVFP